MLVLAAAVATATRPVAVVVDAADVVDEEAALVDEEAMAVDVVSVVAVVRDTTGAADVVEEELDEKEGAGFAEARATVVKTVLWAEGTNGAALVENAGAVLA